jgi:hypothetical protein
LARVFFSATCGPAEFFNPTEWQTHHLPLPPISMHFERVTV